MERFIELTAEDRKFLINVNKIVCVNPYKIHRGIKVMNTVVTIEGGGSENFEEDYETIKDMIKKSEG